MKRFYLLLFVLSLSFNMFAGFGFWDDTPAYVKLSSGETIGLSKTGQPDIVLGKQQSLVFEGYWVKTWKSDGGNNCGVSLGYNIHKANEAKDDSKDVYTDWANTWNKDLEGSGNQEWGKGDLNINLTEGLSEDNYVVEFWFKSYGNPSKQDCDQNEYLSNGGSNYKITFTLGEANPDDHPSYGSSVPSACGDVMLQGFYWGSYSETSGEVKNQFIGSGTTKWTDLTEQAEEIGRYFDLIWLPPSSKSTGGVGYMPVQLSTQSSAWGNRSQLQTLINALHAAGTKVIADVVVNHIAGNTSWCDLAENDFTPYGVFTPATTWIAAQDEMFGNSQAGACSKATKGPDDDGENYGDARDWAHNNAEVREMFKAYMQWLKTEIGYDGYRYDMCKGYHGSHVNEYNQAAQNYFSVGEYWSGKSDMVNFIKQANYNTLLFDFQTKYAINEGIGDGNYEKLKGNGEMLINGYSKYAVTFVDNHDMFSREEGNGKGGMEWKTNGAFLGPSESGAGSMGNYQNRTVQAYAFILTMPGVPCVFYPHWVHFKEQLKPIIDARHLSGVNSESQVKWDEAGNGKYIVEVWQNNNDNCGKMMLKIGPNSGSGECPQGWQVAYQGENCGVYYIPSGTVAPTVAITPGSQHFKDKEAGVEVSLSAFPETASIYYTTDGTDPSETSTAYTAPFTVKGADTLVVKAIAVLNGLKSKINSVVYTYKNDGSEGGTVIDPWGNTGISVKVHLEQTVFEKAAWDLEYDGVWFWVFKEAGKQNKEDHWVEATPLGMNCYGINITDMSEFCFVVNNGKVWGDARLQTHDVVGVNQSACYRIWKIDNVEGDDGSSWKCQIAPVSCGELDVENIEEDQHLIRVENRTVYYDGEFKIFNILGQEMTALNGHLEGMFIVVTPKGSEKIYIP